MRDEEKDAQEAYVPPPCVVCGKPSGCSVWDYRLCYGKPGAPGCAARLWADLDKTSEKVFADKWVARERTKGRAA